MSDLLLRGIPLSQIGDAELLEFLTLFTLREGSDSLGNEADEFVMDALVSELTRRGIEFP